MKCPKCGSNNVTFQIISEQKLKKANHGILYWILIGWWFQPIMWVFFTFYMLLGTMFGHKKTKNRHYTHQHGRMSGMWTLMEA